MILGIDEVGRGPWAGPLVVGAVVLGGAQIDGLTDSKQLTKKRRELLDTEIRERAAGYGLGWVSATELDRVGLAEALRRATRRAVEMVDSAGVCYHEIIIDGTINFLESTRKGQFVTTMKKADALVPSVSAASIIAKVVRDRYMSEQDLRYPEYGFGSNAGYGVAKHRMAIETYGVTPEHRLSFAPLANYRPAGWPAGDQPAVGNVQSKEATDCSNDNRETARTIGDKGEDAAAVYLVAEGHEIITRNWRTRWCEIDIVSSRDKTLYFTEVKYRKNAVFGDGLAAITVQKQRQIRFAAELFLAQHQQFMQCNVCLLAVDVSGNPPTVRQIVEIS